MRLFSQIVQLISTIISEFKQYMAKKRLRDIRSNPADEWLQKFGGKDERDKPTSSSNTQSGDNNQ